MEIRNNYPSPSFGIKISDQLKNRLSKDALKESKRTRRLVAQKIEDIEKLDYPNTELILSRTEARHNECFALAKHTEQGTAERLLKSGYYKRLLLNKFLNISCAEIKSTMEEVRYRISKNIYAKRNISPVKIQESGYTDSFKKLFRHTNWY